MVCTCYLWERYEHHVRHDKACRIRKYLEKNGFSRYDNYYEWRLIKNKHRYACRMYKENFIEEHSYVFCQNCSRSDQYRYSVHHIYTAARYPKHVYLHNPKNLILLCEECHARFHAGELKEEYNKLEADRGLKELFK